MCMPGVIFCGTVTLFTQSKQTGLSWAVIFENSYNTAIYKKRHMRSMQVTRQVQISYESVAPYNNYNTTGILLQSSCSFMRF